MKQVDPNMTIKHLKHTLAETILNKLDNQTGFCHRRRDVAPYRLVLGMLDVFSNHEVKTIAPNDLEKQLMVEVKKAA